jgi:hypothetical protein
MLEACGFPTQVSSWEWDDLTAIQEATCPAPIFADCWDTVEPATWGRIKSLYREP